MATEIKWPGPITFQEDDPKKGYVYIFLTIPELPSKGVFSKNKKPDNVDIHCDFSESEINVEVIVKNADKSTTKYVYFKPSPLDIDKTLCKYKLKNGKLLLVVKKADSVTWTIHARHFIQKPEMVKEGSEKEGKDAKDDGGVGEGMSVKHTQVDD